MIVRGSRGSSFGRQENSFVSRPIRKRRQNLVIGDSKCNTARLPQNFKHDGIAIGFGDAETRCERRRVLPHLAHVCPLLESAGHGRASGGLHCDHARPFAGTYPAEFLQFREGFPHSNQADAAARGIKHCIGIFPTQLLDQFIAHGLLAFNAERLFQRGDVEPALFFFPFRDDASTVGDQAVDQIYFRSIDHRLDVIGKWHVLRHEDVRFNTRRGCVSRESSRCVSSRWNSQFFQAVVSCHGDGECEAARLERGRWVGALLFQERIRKAPAWQHRRPAFAKGHGFDVGQNQAVAPHSGPL